MKIDTKTPWKLGNLTIERHEDNGKVDLSKLALHLEPEQKEDSYINGNLLADRMKGKGLNSAVLKYLLDNPKYIPEEWKGKYIYFWGTVYRSADGDLCVRYLCWSGGRWDWVYHWLDHVWNSGSPAAVSASPLTSNPETPDLKSLEFRISALENKLAKIGELLNRI
jgi:hypothetical protein